VIFQNDVQSFTNPSNILPLDQTGENAVRHLFAVQPSFPAFDSLVFGDFDE
jgi:glutamyl-tRNA reductase